ncbi:MAG: UDP-N-acetylmuramoyl-tripeptide--D-alanyl-D-alanine ligase, partial [Actinomycetota bacterium]
TKDLLAAVLRRDRPTHASVRSFNNEIGVPLTLLAAPDATRAVVIEMGARGVGHIATLCRPARPTVGIVTAVGKAHTSEFGSVEAVALGKGELVEALPSSGHAVLNADNPHVAAMADRTDATVITFGAAGEIRAEAIVVGDDLVPTFRLVSPWGAAEVRLGVQGDHLIPNALAAAGAALPLGVSLDDVAAGLAEPDRSPMRMAVHTAPSGARVIDDTYNANPLSVAGAIDALAGVPAERRIAVLGMMAELGDSSVADHERMLRLATERGIDVIAVDAAEYGAGARHVDDIAEAEAALGALGASDAVLVKGSRIAALERLVVSLTRAR